MKYLMFFLFLSTVCLAQDPYPQRASTLTVTEKIVYQKTQSSHGLAVGNWITVSGSSYVKGSDPSSQPFVGIISNVPNSNTFVIAKPGEFITGLSGLTAGLIYYAQSDGTIGTTSSPKPVLIATSETTGEVLSGTFGAILPPPTNQSSTMSFTNITSTSVTASVSRGNGDGVLMLLYSGSLAGTPNNNQFYTADPVFGDGDVIGGAYVVLAEDGSSVNITGLTPNTNYQGVAYEYSTQGVFITYNTLTGTNGFVTLQAATTPTTPFITTGIRHEEDRIRITGTRGNGDNIVVIASTLGQPDTDISDGTNPTSGAYGAGTAVGNGYVVYEGAAHDFHITGFSQDRMVWWKIYEREDTGFLYNIQGAIDSVWAAFTYDSLFTAGSAPAGQIYLESNAEVYYDFTQLTGADGASISNGDAGLVDYGPGAYTGTIVNTPLVQETTISSETVKTMESNTSNGAVNSGHSGTDWIQGNDFEIWHGIVHQDGQHGGTNYYSGGSNTGATTVIRVESITTGHLRVIWTNTGGNFIWQSTNAVFANGVNAHKILRIRFDFTGDALTVTDNGSTVAGSFISGNISTASSATWSSDQTLYVGQYLRSTGAMFGQTTNFYTTRFAITPLLTTGQASDVQAFFNYIPTGSGSFVDWTPHEVTGFTYSTVDDTLNLDGQPGGYRDYITHNRVITDSLEEFSVKYTFKISDDLASGDNGTGPIIINDLTSEPNYAVYGLFVTNPASANFGKLQIYSGDGTVSETAFVFRSQSSGALVPAKDSVYSIELTRTIDSNINAFYTLTIIDLYDSSTLTTSYLGVGAASSNYIGTTMKAGVWQNGGPFKVNPFSVTRVGLYDIVPGGGSGSGSVTYEVWVTKSGNDSNACTEALPCLTTARGFARVDELGPGTDMFIGPGTFVETTFNVIPTDLDTLDGSGVDQTIIKGASNLYTDISTSGNGSPFSSYGYLFSFSSATSTNDPTVMRNFTMEGNRNVGGYADSMKGGIFVNNRDELNLDAVDLKYFWNAGIWIQATDSIVIRNSHLQRNGFSNPAPAPTITYSLGNIQLFGTVTRIWVIDCFIDSPILDEGQGIQHSGSPNFYRVDLHVHGGTIDVGNSTDAEDHHFAMEILYYFMQSGDSISVQNVLLKKNLSFNYTGPELGTHFIHGNRFDFTLNNKNLAIEAQFGNAEICHNYFTGILGKVIGTYNPWGSGVSTNCPRDCHADNEVWDNLYVHHNVIEHTGESFIDGIFGDFRWRRNNFTFENNTVIHAIFGIGAQAYRMFQPGNQGTNSNWLIQNNAFYGIPISGSSMWGSSTLTSSTARYNKATNLDVTATKSGVTSSNNTVTGSGNTLGFNLSGSKFPVVSGSYYAWPTGNTVLKNTGNGGADIGAYTD